MEPIHTEPFDNDDDAERRRKTTILAAAALAVLVVCVAVIVVAGKRDAKDSDREVAAGPTTTAAVATPTTAAAPATSAVTAAPTTAATTPPTAPPPINVTPPAPVPVSRADLEARIARLAISTENDAGYSRSEFKHWTDDDDDGCDTRREVLIAESLTPVKVGAKCALSGGTWYSTYDGVTGTEPGELDVDHRVALAEAWRSGASAWPNSRRQAYANDMEHSYSLIAVTAASNRSKGDDDPSEWMPPRAQDWCDYASQWVNVKLDWSLTADEPEIAKLRQVAETC